MKRFGSRSVASALLVGAAVLVGCTDNSPMAADEAQPIVSLDMSMNGTDGDVQPIMPGRLVVRFRQGANPAAIAAANGASLRRQMRLERTWVLDVSNGNERRLARVLGQNPNVEFAEPDYMDMVIPCEVGNCADTEDWFFGRKWDLHNDGKIVTNADNPAILATTGKVDADMDWLEAFDHLGADFGGSAVIAILDSGIRATHGDLAGKVIAARNFADGYPADFIDDRDGHGTHVAGIAAASGALAMRGVAYGKNIKLINAKVCEQYRFPDGSIRTSCPSSGTADAIVWATDQGANVLNLSLGGPWNATAGSAAQQAAFQYARSKNVLPFCATGNDGQNGISFPARFPECVAVGSTNWSDTRANYSNFGPQIELTAPGGQSYTAAQGGSFGLIFSLSNSANNTYRYMAGTSMATPQAAGLAGLLFATGMTGADEVLERMKSTTDDLGTAGWDQHFGAGRINIYRAITGQDPNAPPVADIGGAYTGTEGTAVQFDGSKSVDPNGKPLRFDWNFGDGSTGTGAKPSHTFKDNGVYTVTLVVTDESNLTHTVTTAATIGNVAPNVNASLSAASILSGQSVSLTGGFSDPGILDAPWNWSINWGTGTPTTGSAAFQTDVIRGTQRFCSATTYNVVLSVTDKDGGTGAATSALTVNRNVVSMLSPSSVSLNNLTGTLPVHVLSTGSFDATSIDPATVRLSDGTTSGASVARRNNGTLHAVVEDVNKDGRMDLTLHFNQSEMGLTSASAQLVLLGALKDGCTEVRAANAMRTVP